MIRLFHKPGADPNAADRLALATDTAWRIHSALTDWTGKVDTKASFALAIESAVMAAIISLMEKGRRLSDLDGLLQLGSFWIGLGLLMIGVLLAIAVVVPQLRTRRVAEEWPDNYIYFGHLRYWEPAALVEALKNRDQLDVLSRQLVAMGEIAWKKHRRLQLSLLASVLGTGLVMLATLLQA